MISLSASINGDIEPVSRAKQEWCELGQSSGLPGGGDIEASVTAGLSRYRERESRVRQFGAALGLEVGQTQRQGYKFMRCRQTRRKVRWVMVPVLS